MTGFALLDVAIGVIFAVLTFSLVASALQESLASVFNWRGRFLRRGLFRLLEAEDNSRALLTNTVFWPKMPGVSKATLDRVELTFEVLNDPSLRALHGSKSFLGTASDWLTGLGNLGKNRAARKLQDKVKRDKSVLDQERTDRVVAALAKPELVADSAALSAEVARIDANIAGRKADIDEAEEVAPAIERSGRVPSAIPKETFAKALIDTLHRRIETAIKDAKDKVRANANAKAVAIESAIANTHAEALKDADAAKKRAIEAGDPLPADPNTIADDLVYATFGALAPGRAYAEAYAKAMSQAVDAAAKGVAETIEDLPMSRAMKSRLTKVLRDVSVARAVEEHLAKVGEIWEGAETMLEAHVQAMEAKATMVTQEIAAWFDHGMDRVTGWYIRRAKYVLFLIGMAMAAAVNFNIIGYAGELLRNDALRDQVVARAELAVQSGQVGALKVDRSSRMTLLALAVRQEPGPRDDVGKLTTTKVQTYLFSLEDLETLGLASDAATATGTLKPIAVAQVTEALQKAAPDLVVDTDGNGVTEAEIDAAITATLKEIGDTVTTTLNTLDNQLGGSGYSLGWACKDVNVECVKSQVTAAGVLSWFLMGIACTFGGQFWFDLLKSLIGVRTAATGLNSDIKEFVAGPDGDKDPKSVQEPHRPAAPGMI